MAMPTQIKSLKNLLSTDLHGTMRFEVKGVGHDLGEWSHCTGLSVRFDNKLTADAEYNGTRVRPGQPSYGDVKLKRALSHSGAQAVQTWLEELVRKPDRAGVDVEIRLVDSWGKTVVEWKLYNVVPKSWSGPDLDGSPSSKQVAIETLELSHDGFLAHHKDRPIGGRFEIHIDGETLGYWTQCDGLGIRFDNKQVVASDSQGQHVETVPGKPSYGELKLRRSMDGAGSKKVRDWLLKHLREPRKDGCIAKVTLFDTWDEELGEWSFEGVIPRSWSGPSLDAATKQVAVETLELSHSGFHNTTAKAGGAVTVRLGDKDLGTWTKVSGLQVEFPTSPRSINGNTNTQNVVSGPAKWSTLKLSRPLDVRNVDKVMSWLSTTADSRKTTATVTLHDHWGKEGPTWHFEEVSPTKWTGPNLDAGRSDLLEESLDLVHGGFSIRAPGSGGSPGGTGTTPTVVSGNDGGKTKKHADGKPLEHQKATLGVDEKNTVKFKSADPSSLTITRAARYLTVPHAVGSTPLGHSRNEYRGSGAATLSMDVELHSPAESGDASVDHQCTLLQSWMVPTSTGRPPALLTFTWCSVTFKGYLRDLAIAVTQFGSDTKPSIARVSLTLQEELELPKFTNPTSGGPPGHRVHVLAEGDTLHSVAFREYGEASAWRGLAAANGIDDPLRVAPGTRLQLPPAV
ncbi:MAG TPA: phage tail protein [Candidatus Dormibacteraeota bacterium]|jgi:phage tail-like protein